MATPRRIHRHAGPSGALYTAGRRVGRAHGRIIAVGVAPTSTKDNWAATGDAVREAWVTAGDELRGAMVQIATEQEEIPA